MPPAPEPQAIAAILLAVFALFLFTRERIPLESSSLWVFLAIMVGFQIFPVELDGERLGSVDLFAGFGHEALVTIVALLVLAKGLEATGALYPVIHGLSRLWSAAPQTAFLVTLLVAAVLSMFLNNTPIVAMVLPLLVAVSLRAGVAPSGILMPVGFATIVGGMATTIGTSTNLLVTAIAADLGMRRMQMFDFALPVVIVGSVAIVYLWLVAPRLLPRRDAPLSDASPRVFRATLLINPDSNAEGKTLSEITARTRGRMRVDRIERGKGIYLVKLPTVTIRAGDRLHMDDSPENLKEFERLLGATLTAAGEAGLPVSDEHPLTAAGQQLAEVVVTHGSMLHHRSLSAVQFVDRFGLIPLAIFRPRAKDAKTTQNLESVMLRSGDVVLVQGPSERIQALKASGEMLVLDGRVDLPHTRKAPLAAALIVAVVVVAAAGIAPISVAAVCGVGLMLLTGCLNWRHIVDALDRRIILLIVASLALGLALMATGGAEYIAMLFVALTKGWSVPLVLCGFILVFALLTEVATNNAVAVLGTPIAISVAQQLGAPIEPFVLGVLFGANMSYMTPVGYQTNLLVMSAGGYRFSDFFRAGLPLQIIMWLGLSIVLPILYDL
jgi:di/tricarboxylate transporter